MPKPITDALHEPDAPEPTEGPAIEESPERPPAPVPEVRRPRGRPRAFDREAALDTAMRLFWLKGYDATSISDLTDAMGIGSPSLYASFGSKDGLYAEALKHYAKQHEALVFTRFFDAQTAREAVQGLLVDTAQSLTSDLFDVPYGCMVTLSTVDRDAHPELNELVRASRAVTLERLKARLADGVSSGEIPAQVDIHALSRFLQTVQNGMSILARDGAGRQELVDVAALAMAGWDARLAAAS